MPINDYKPYDPEELEHIKSMLEAEHRGGNPISFDVKVDGLTRIHKTNKVERFSELYNFINEQSKELVISIYPDASTNRKEWYKYVIRSGPSEGLNGPDIDQKLNERMQLFEERHHAKRTEEKLAEVQQQVKEAEDYIQLLESRLEEVKTKPNHFGDWDLGKLAGTAIQGIATHHPAIFEKVPVLNGIAKVIQEDLKNKSGDLNGSFEGDVSFKPKSPNGSGLSASEQKARQLMKFLDEKFTQEEQLLLNDVIAELGEDPSKLKTIAELLELEDEEQTEEEITH